VRTDALRGAKPARFVPRPVGQGWGGPTTNVRGTAGKDLRELIAKEINPVVRAWGNFFRHGNASQVFKDTDVYVAQRIKQWLKLRGGQRTRYRFSLWPMRRSYEEMDLNRLSNSRVYANEAAREDRR
jgi:hypothetical protein